MTKQKFSKYASVVVDIGINKLLDYGVPDEINLDKGFLVEVPIRGHLRRGYVVDVKDKSDYPSVFSIKKSLSTTPVLTEELHELALWMSKYYCTPLQKIIKTILPSEIRKKTKC